MEVPQETPKTDGGEGHRPEETPSLGHIAEPQPAPQLIEHMADLESKESLANEPLRPTLEALAELDRKDPKLAFQAARILGIYRRMWESCVSKHVESKEQAQRNQTLEEAKRHLSKERETLQRRYNEQLSHLRFFDHTLHSSRVKLNDILSQWKQGFSGEQE
ncbi:hypothetical protein N7540_011109 [Penicillium herquei]|nr:hypothetical protein N7540_011109 [Penicillium herquei]